MPNWLQVRLVDDWRNFTKWWTVRLNALYLVVMGLFASAPLLPAQVAALVPNPGLQAKLAGLWVILNMIARVIKQPLS